MKKRLRELHLNKSDISIAKKLSTDIYSEFGNLNCGGCGVFAKAMNEKFKTNSFLYVFEKDGFDQDPPIHIYFKLKRGKFLDVLGLYTKKEIKETYGSNYYFLEWNQEILEDYYQELGEEGFGVIDYKEHYSLIKQLILKR